MSQAPHVVRGARWGLRLGPSAPLEDLLWEALKDPQCGLSMAETAEGLAEKYKLTRKEVDEVALASQQRARSEEHTSELQSRLHLVCRLLLEKKKTKRNHTQPTTADRLP